MSFDLKTALITYLSGKTLLTALLDVLPDGVPAISPDILSQVQKRPYIFIKVDGEVDKTHIGGAIAMTDAPVAIQIYSDTSIARTQIKNALRNILSGRYNDTLTDGTNSVKFESWFTHYVEGKFLTLQDGTETGVYTGTVLFKFSYNQAVPTLP